MSESPSPPQNIPHRSSVTTPPPVQIGHSSVSTGSPKVHVLKPVEGLLRWREVHGYAVIKEVQNIIKRAIKGPPSGNRCLVVMGGPDALALPLCEPGVEFLCDTLGFQCEMDPESGTTLQLPRDYEVDSADWISFKAKGEEALRELEWVEEANSSELTIKLHSLTFSGQAISAPIRVEVAVDWRDELGNEMSQIFTNTTNKVGSESTYLDHQHGVTKTVSGSVESFHYPLMMTLSTRCDAPSCSVNVTILRKRLVSDKVKAKCHYHYQHVRPSKDKIILKDPDQQHLAVGSIMCEVSSLSQLFAENEAAEEKQRLTLSALEDRDKVASGNGGENVDVEKKRRSSGKAVPFVEHSEKGPDDEGIKYDADDYF